jgi:tRNA(Ile)-lysidine synthase
VHSTHKCAPCAAGYQKSAALVSSPPRTGVGQLLYHFPVDPLADQLLKKIRKQRSIRAGDRVAAAVSGGADSVALLCLLLELRGELGIVLSVAHVNHKLRAEESDGDERFVAELAQRHGLEFHLYKDEAPAKRGDRSDSGSLARSGIEAAARKLRYGFFRQLARESRVDKIATAHTLDDQAETVLLRVFRGTGIRGLSGIHPRIVFSIEDQGCVVGEVVRPLLPIRRSAIREFLRERGENWREDSSNLDIGFVRNRVRHELLPTIIEKFGQAAIERTAELAEIARAEEEHWELGHAEVRGLSEGRAQQPQSVASLPIGPLLALPLAAQRRVVRRWLEANAKDKNKNKELSISFRLIEEILDLARGAPGRKMELTGGQNRLRQNLRRGQSELCLESEPLLGPSEADHKNSYKYNYEYSLAIPGSVEVLELGVRIEARVIDAGAVPEIKDDEKRHLLDFELVPKELLIRNWRAGDRYWPAHTAASRKVKELLSDRHASGLEKKLWPVAVADERGLIWMRGFAVPAAFQPSGKTSKVIWIRDTASMM